MTERGIDTSVLSEIVGYSPKLRLLLTLKRALSSKFLEQSNGDFLLSGIGFGGCDRRSYA